MKRNMGKPDRTIRILLALIIAGLGFYFNSWWGLIAIVPAVTALGGFCAVYRLLGITTCATKPAISKYNE